MEQQENIRPPPFPQGSRASISCDIEGKAGITVITSAVELLENRVFNGVFGVMTMDFSV